MGVALDIRLASDDEASSETKEQLQRLLGRFDLSRWIFTQEVIIDPHSIPHSHPVLTLHTRHLDDDDLFLATFLHEQLHWYLASKPEAVWPAVEELRSMFPSVPVGYPDGGEDEESSYVHLAVNYLEYCALHAVRGADVARRVLEFWAQDHYRWIYQTVLDQCARIREVMLKHGVVAAEDAV